MLGQEAAVPAGRAGRTAGSIPVDGEPLWTAHLLGPEGLAGVDLHEIAIRSPSIPMIRWTDAATREHWLGIGAVDDLAASDADSAWGMPTECRRRLASIRAPAPARPLLRYFGGIAFDPADERLAEWKSGGRGRFVLPRVILRRSSAGGLTQGVWIAPPRDTSGDDGLRDAVTRLLARIESRAGSFPHPAHPLALTLCPDASDREGWGDSVRQALDAIDRGEIRKVVLSRDLLYRSPADAEETIGYLSGITPRVARGYVFCFRFEPDEAFFGATPERLVSQAGTTVWCDCLAGTGPAEGDDRGDDEATSLLLRSEKDAREHNLVRDGIVSSLGPVARWLEVETRPGVVRLAGLHHLSTSIRGSLHDGVEIGDLLRRLHPTPAVGGSPRDEANAMIRRLEGRSRGWYAGPVGWVGIDGADFAVGIRSGIVRGRTVRIFAGAGIVSGSDPDAEWDETERKAASLLSILTEAPV